MVLINPVNMKLFSVSWHDQDWSFLQITNLSKEAKMNPKGFQFHSSFIKTPEKTITGCNLKLVGIFDCK